MARAAPLESRRTASRRTTVARDQARVQCGRTLAGSRGHHTGRARYAWSAAWRSSGSWAIRTGLAYGAHRSTAGAPQRSTSGHTWTARLYEESLGIFRRAGTTADMTDARRWLGGSRITGGRCDARAQRSTRAAIGSAVGGPMAHRLAVESTSGDVARCVDALWSCGAVLYDESLRYSGTADTQLGWQLAAVQGLGM